MLLRFSSITLRQRYDIFLRTSGRRPSMSLTISGPRPVTKASSIDAASPFARRLGLVEVGMAVDEQKPGATPPARPQRAAEEGSSSHRRGRPRKAPSSSSGARASARVIAYCAQTLWVYGAPSPDRGAGHYGGGSIRPARVAFSRSGEAGTEQRIRQASRRR